MSKLPFDPFFRSQLPLALLSRRDRVRMLMEAAAMLIDSGNPAGLFVGGALTAYLHDPDPRADLLRDYLRIRPERGNQLTAARIVADIERLKEFDDSE